MQDFRQGTVAVAVAAVTQAAHVVILIHFLSQLRVSISLNLYLSLRGLTHSAFSKGKGESCPEKVTLMSVVPCCPVLCNCQLTVGHLQYCPQLVLL